MCGTRGAHNPGDRRGERARPQTADGDGDGNAHAPHRDDGECGQCALHIDLTQSDATACAAEQTVTTRRFGPVVEKTAHDGRPVA